MSSILEQLDRLLEFKPGTLSGTEQLENLGSWDSLSVIGFIALADEKFSIKVSPAEIHQAETVSDLAALLNTRNAP